MLRPSEHFTALCSGLIGHRNFWLLGVLVLALHFELFLLAEPDNLLDGDWLKIMEDNEGTQPP